MKLIKNLLLFFVFGAGSIFICSGQNYGPFNNESFPVEVISGSIIKKRSLQSQMELLANCDWKSRQGKFIDTFWLQTQKGNYFGRVYEYFMDCDNVRLIYWYRNPSGKGPIVDFMIEDLEDDSAFVVAKRKHLKNKKKYKHLIKVE